MVGAVLLLINAVSFAVCGADKRRARRGERRVRERTLWRLSAGFGALGMLAGMHVFRHKTRHSSFRVGVPLLMAAQALLLWRLYALDLFR